MRKQVKDFLKINKERGHILREENVIYPHYKSQTSISIFQRLNKQCKVGNKAVHEKRKVNASNSNRLTLPQVS